MSATGTDPRVELTTRVRLLGTAVPLYRYGRLPFSSSRRLVTAKLVSLIRNLQRRGERRRSSLAVLEGVRLIEDALAAGVPLRGAVASDALDRTERGAVLRRRLGEGGVAIESVSDDDLAALADTDTPQGIVAVAEPHPWTALDLQPGPGRPVLAVDGVQDPGNVGALIRTAWSLGAAGVVLLPGCARLTHPKVLRAAMGGTWRVPAIAWGDDEFAEWLARHSVTLWTAASCGPSVGATPRPERLCLLVGNEGAGVRDRWRDAAGATVGVNMADGAESLNVAVAAGILLHEVIRDA